MRAARNPLLAIRTVLVTTRAAVLSHRKAGADGLARDSVHRGIELLTDVGDRIGIERDGELAEQYEDAMRELRSLDDSPTSSGS